MKKMQDSEWRRRDEIYRNEISYKNIFFLFFIIMLSHSSLYALKVETHMDLNEYIARSPMNGFYLDAYLKNVLGFQEGINQSIGMQKLYLWLREGGAEEDQTDHWYTCCRFKNHFHNPITNEGLWLGGYSSLDWAFMNIDQQSPGGAYSWKDVRQNFFNALTYAGTDLNETEAWRQYYMAETFRGLGQLMHLVQDLSVPAHARNDAHIIDDNILSRYELWMKNRNHFTLDQGSFLLKLLDTNLQHFIILNSFVFFDTNALCKASRLNGKIPATNLFDNEKYFGNDPSVTMDSDAGISEYTNANFFSDDTLFSGFNYPSKSGTFVKPYEDTATGEKWTYLAKDTDGETVEFLAKCSWLYGYLPPDANIDELGLKFDDRVYACYAQKLIPRAVGYSVGLLQYFFRGKIQISLPENGYYALATDPNEGFKTIKVLAQNVSDFGENMLGGRVHLVIKYREPQCAPGACDPFYSFTNANNLSAFNTVPKYVTVPYDDPMDPANNDKVIIPRNDAIELTFSLNDANVIPLYAGDVSLYLVYTGLLGKDQDNKEGNGAVPQDGEYAVAVGFKDISEPTPIDIVNNRDWICIDNNHWRNWYKAGSQEAIDQVDKTINNPYGNDNGKPDEHDIYAHHLTNIYVKFSTIDNPKPASPTDYDFFIPRIDAGKYARKGFLLTDDLFWQSTLCSTEPADPNHDKYLHATNWVFGYEHEGAMIKFIWTGLPNKYNQAAKMYYEFRGVKFFHKELIINAAYSPGSLDPYDQDCDDEGADDDCYCIYDSIEDPINEQEGGQNE
jgi:hypothetical protein